MAVTAKKKAAARKAAAIPSSPKFKVVAGGKQGPKPGRESRKKTAARKARAPRKARVPAPAVNTSMLPKDFEKIVLEMATSPEGVTRSMLVRRAKQTNVAWRPWMEALAAKHNLLYSVSAGRPVFKLKKVTARKSA